MKRIVLISVLIFLISCCSCVQSQSSASPQGVNISAIKNQTVGAIPPVLDYADENYSVFHSYFGLFVVKNDDGSIYRSLDLEEIDCNYMSGDMVTNVKVSQNGENVYIYNESIDSQNNNIYKYNIENNDLSEVDTLQKNLSNSKTVSALEIDNKLSSDNFYSDVICLSDTKAIFLQVNKPYNISDIKLIIYDPTANTKSEFSIFI